VTIRPQQLQQFVRKGTKQRNQKLVQSICDVIGSVVLDGSVPCANTLTLFVRQVPAKNSQHTFIHRSSFIEQLSIVMLVLVLEKALNALGPDPLWVEPACH